MRGCACFCLVPKRERYIYIYIQFLNFFFGVRGIGYRVRVRVGGDGNVGTHTHIHSHVHTHTINVSVRHQGKLYRPNETHGAVDILAWGTCDSLKSGQKPMGKWSRKIPKGELPGTRYRFDYIFEGFSCRIALTRAVHVTCVNCGGVPGWIARALPFHKSGPRNTAKKVCNHNTSDTFTVPSNHNVHSPDQGNDIDESFSGHCCQGGILEAEVSSTHYRHRR